MQPRFADLLAAASASARHLDEDGVLSLALPLAVVDPLPLLRGPTTASSSSLS